MMENDSDPRDASTVSRVVSTLTAAALAWVAAVLAMSCTFVLVNGLVDDNPCRSDGGSGEVTSILVGIGFVIVEGLAGAVFAWFLGRRWDGYPLVAGIVTFLALLVPAWAASILVLLLGVCFR